jgi:hypothetical protein
VALTIDFEEAVGDRGDDMHLDMRGAGCVQHVADAIHLPLALHMSEVAMLSTGTSTRVPDGVVPISSLRSVRLTTVEGTWFERFGRFRSTARCETRPTFERARLARSLQLWTARRTG